MALKRTAWRGTPGDEWRGWWMLHGSDMVRLAIILAVGAAAVVASLVFMVGTNLASGPTRLVPGQIAAFHQTEGKYGSHPYVVVRLDSGGTATLGAPANEICHEGQRVMIEETPTLLGVRYHPHQRLCGP